MRYTSAALAHTLMKINSFLTRCFARMAGALSLTMAAGAFLPQLRAAEYHYTAANANEVLTLKWSPFKEPMLFSGHYHTAWHDWTENGNIMTINGVDERELPTVSNRDNSVFSFIAGATDRIDPNLNADNNYFEIRDSFLTLVVSGYSYGGNADNNEMLLVDTILDDDALAGVSRLGNADGNKVTLVNTALSTRFGNSPGKVIGGWSRNGNACNNEVYITEGSEVVNQVYGGYTYVEGNANNNSIVVSDSVIGYEGKTGDSLFGGEAVDGDAIGNQVVMTNDAVVNGNVIGGHVCNWEDKNENLVYSAGSANDNLVQLDHSRINGNIYGGKANGTGNASGNTVLLWEAHCNSDTEDRTIYGGWSALGKANGNYVILHQEGNEAPGWTLANTVLHGGYGNNIGKEGFSVEEEFDMYTRGNYLIIDGYRGEIKDAQHFEFIVFNDPLLNSDEALITLLDEESEDGNPNAPEMRRARIMVRFSDPDEVPVGAVINTGLGTARNITIPGAQKGFTCFTHFETTTDENDNVIINRKFERVNPQAKALSEGRIAEMTLNNSAADLAAGQGLEQAARASEHQQSMADGKESLGEPMREELRPRKHLFFAMSGGHTSVESGSHVNVDGTSLLFGASGSMLRNKALTMGAFVEGGWGKYSTHNYFADMPSVRGTGESSYAGAGILLRYQLEHLNKRLSGVELDATLRTGRQATDFGSIDYMDNAGRLAAYEMDSPYMGAHVGLNYKAQLWDKLAALFYGRYLWSHIGSERAELSDTESVNFRSMSSNRLRGGFRLSWQLTQRWTPFLGAAYEWECSGAAHATAPGEVGAIAAPSMRGGSVIGEIGTVWQPNINRALWVEGSLQGSCGKKEGYGAKLGVSIGF